jgi:hypothetical protein
MTLRNRKPNSQFLLNRNENILNNNNDKIIGKSTPTVREDFQIAFNTMNQDLKEVKKLQNNFVNNINSNKIELVKNVKKSSSKEKTNVQKQQHQREPIKAFNSDFIAPKDKMNSDSNFKVKDTAEKQHQKQAHTPVTPPPQPQNSQTLFHPSKINMSSTPIKPSKYPEESDIKQRQHEPIFPEKDDTPIKGHKIKYMLSNEHQLISRLAERYFPRSDSPNEPKIKENKTSNDFKSRTTNNFNSNSVNLINEFKSKSSSIKNEDEAFSDEILKNKELFKQKMLNSILNNNNKSKNDSKNIKNKSASNLYSLESPLKTPRPQNKFPNPMKSSHLSFLDEDESLNRLRQKQREFLKAKKFPLTTPNALESFETNKEEDKANNTSQMSSSCGDECENSDSFNSSMEQFKKAEQSQNQLRIYIQNLETKLNNLRTEMNDNNNDNFQSNSKILASKRRERSLSNESCDSLKELKIKTTNILNSRSCLLNEILEKKISKKNDLKPSAAQKSMIFDDDCEKSFIETQLNCKKDEEEILSGMNQLSETDSNKIKEKEKNRGDDLLEKSLHKSSLTELFFAKSIRKSSHPKMCDFTPISNQNLPEFKIESIKHENLLSTSTSSRLLLNPKPIRLSLSSSSFDSTNLNNLNSPRISSSNDINSPRSTTTSSSANNIQFNAANSKIWKQKTSNSKWSTILADQSASNNQQPIVANNNNTYSKDLLVKNLAEACKKEMSLLNCLKDNQNQQTGMEDYYLSQIEEMLEQKVNSIRDLQSQLRSASSTANHGYVNKK